MRLDEGAADIMISDESHLKWNTALLGVSQGRGYPAVWNGHHYIHTHVCLFGKPLAKGLPNLVNGLVEYYTVRPGEVDKFKDALGELHLGKWEVALQPVLVYDQDLARRDVPQVLGLDEVKRTGLAGQDVRVLKFAQTKRAKTIRVSCANQLIFAHGDERKGSPHLLYGLNDPLGQIVSVASGNKVDYHLAVHGRAEYAAITLKFSSQMVCIHQITVVGKGERPERIVDGDGLGISQLTLSPSRIACMPDSNMARKS